MNEERNEEGRFTAGGKGLGTVTEKMVRKRARELALINGRVGTELLDSDLEQARRELLSQEHLVPEPTPSESVLEDQRWDPVGGSKGSQAPTVSAPDEQTFAEKLVEEGVEDAEHDQMVRATRASLERDRGVAP